MEKPFRLWIRATWYAIALSALTILAMVLLSMERVDWQTHAWYLFFSIPALLFALILLPILYHYRKKYVKSLAELTGGGALVHWHYDPDEWYRFVETEWSRMKRKALWLPLSMVAGVAVLGYLFKDWGAEEMKLFLPWIFAVAMFAAGIVYAVGHHAYRSGMEKVGEVYVGERAVQYGDTFFTWDTLGTKLGKVELLKGDQPILQFEIRQVGRYGTRSSELRVPVPRKHKKEAEQLIARFSL